MDVMEVRETASPYSSITLFLLAYPGCDRPDL